mgnify:FL=1
MVTYVILNTAEITDEESVIDFSKLMSRNASMLRYNLDRSRAIVKYKGEQPSFLNGKKTYTHSEIKAEIAKSDWTTEE